MQICGSDIGLIAVRGRAAEGPKRAHGGIGGQSSPYSARDRPHSDVDRTSEHVNHMPYFTGDPYVARADDAVQEYEVLANRLHIRSEGADATQVSSHTLESPAASGARNYPVSMPWLIEPEMYVALSQGVV
ncbi:hypothetical protein ADIAG_00900 [Paeniglutamicibacter gangotriensis Lz1y]|uniref:Uncharacterized protein n=1 Tax=Paeniglutamicibacter gangotriensis Lz1y TaxID=1276920 RepID=M7MTS1_9MICC|nr:hypothetical protein ADIAG_00900 [Paeniglutamicibacter gangotriensis Lz1y]